MDDNRVKLFSRLGIFLAVLLVVAVIFGRTIKLSYGEFGLDIGGPENGKTTEPGEDGVTATQEPEDDAAPEPTEAVPAVAITLPAQGTTVARDLTMNGTYENVPDDLAVWVYVYSAEDGVYTFVAAETLSDGTWTAEVVVGAKGASDSGNSYTLGVALANDAAVKNILDNYEELPVLPGGANVMDEVVVTRE